MAGGIYPCIANTSRAAFYTPKTPKLPGIDQFAGTTLHAVNFNRHQEEFRGKRVLLVGFHASSQDVAVALHKNGAAQVYVSHRNGVRMVSFSRRSPPLSSHCA